MAITFCTMDAGNPREVLIAKLGLAAYLLGPCSFVAGLTQPGFILGIPAAALAVALGLYTLTLAIRAGIEYRLLQLPILATLVAVASLVAQVWYLVTLPPPGR